LLDRGTIIDNKYEVLASIGKGGMSRVYLARDLRLNKQWAIKEIEKKGKKSGYIIKSALDEANLIKRLDHPMLPRIVDIIDTTKGIYIIMDYIEGEPLIKILQKNGPQPQNVVIEWAKQLCQALEYLHTRKPSIIYRDMKPGNVMLKPDGNVKLIDFGIAREYKEESDGDTTCLGTKGYAAPEQFGGKGQTDPRTDVYCLGVTIYHLVTGHCPTEPPYEIKPIRQWNDKLSGGLENIILKATQYNPQDRYQSCAEMLYALNHYEEVDDAYYAKQKGIFMKFAFFATSALLCLGLAIGGLFYKNSLINQQYETLLYQADNSKDDKESEDKLRKAIDLDPLRLEAYNSLIKLYKHDSDFSQAEEEVIYQSIKSNSKIHDQLVKKEGYSELAYEIGCAYWYFYNYKSETAQDVKEGMESGLTENQRNRITGSVRWFTEVDDIKDENKRKLAKIYSSIGEFHRDIKTNQEQGQTKTQFKKYWENMNDMLASIKDSDEEVVKLEVYRLISCSVFTYMDDFFNDGVSEEDIKKMIKDVKEKNSRVKTTTEKTKNMKSQIDFYLSRVRFNGNLNI